MVCEHSYTTQLLQPSCVDGTLELTQLKQHVDI